jgi:hypothetical protein
MLFLVAATALTTKAQLKVVPGNNVSIGYR